jgi:hypothetical protein
MIHPAAHIRHLLFFFFFFFFFFAIIPHTTRKNAECSNYFEVFHSDYFIQGGKENSRENCAAAAAAVAS